MTRRLRRQHVLAAVMVTTLAAAATGCSTGASHTTTPSGASHTTAPSGANAATSTPSATPNNSAQDPDAPTITDGGSNVLIGGVPVAFASAVTDASWSPDGSRLAYVDANGNIATARPDGTDVRVLTRTNAKLKRAHPAWQAAGQSIVFTERGADGVWRLTTVVSDLAAADQTEQAVYYGEDGESSGDTAPSTAARLSDAVGDFDVNRVAYQHAGKGGPEIWILDNNQREPSSTKLVAGSQPALSPNGATVAFVGTAGQIFVNRVGVKGAKPVQVTFSASGVSAPAWSVDGKRIAFRTTTDIESVSANPATGARTNPARVESTSSGVPTYRPRLGTTTTRIADADPVTAAITLSRSRWRTAAANGAMVGPWSRYAVGVTLVDVNNPAAAGAAIESSWYAGPVLFVRGSTLDGRVRAELSRVLRPNGATVTVVGNVSSTIVAAVTAMGYAIDRANGIVEASPDSLAGAPKALVLSSTDAAAIVDSQFVLQSVRVPAIVVDGPSLSAAQRAAINALGTQAGGAHATPTVYTVGADAAAALRHAWSGRPAMNIVDLSAPDASAESARLVQAFANGPITVALAPTTSWQMQVLAAGDGRPALLVDPNQGLSAAATQWLTGSSGSISTVYAFGVPSAVSDATLADAAAAVSGPGGTVSVAPTPIG